MAERQGRHVDIRWDASGHRSQRGWYAHFPSGARRRWHYTNEMQFNAWVLSHLRGNGDSVTVHYTRSIITYRMETKPVKEA